MCLLDGTASRSLGSPNYPPGRARQSIRVEAATCSGRCPPPRCASTSQAPFLLNCARNTIALRLHPSGDQGAAARNRGRDQGTVEAGVGGGSYNGGQFELQTYPFGFRTMLGCRASCSAHKVE